MTRKSKTPLDRIFKQEAKNGRKLTDSELGEVMHLDRTAINRFRNGQRELHKDDAETILDYINSRIPGDEDKYRIEALLGIDKYLTIKEYEFNYSSRDFIRGYKQGKEDATEELHEILQDIVTAQSMINRSVSRLNRILYEVIK